MRSLRYAGLLSLAAALGLLIGCGRHSNKETYYLISNNINLPYWKTAIAGFQKAAAQYDVTAKIDGPTNYDAQDAIEGSCTTRSPLIQWASSSLCPMPLCCSRKSTPRSTRNPGHHHRLGRSPQPSPLLHRNQ